MAKLFRRGGISSPSRSVYGPGPVPTTDDPPPPTLTVTLELADPADYVVAVEFAREGLVPTEISVRRAPDADGKPRAVSAREIARLPLTRIRDAALEIARNPSGEQLLETLELPRVPPGHPERGKAVAFYREIADFYRAAKSKGISPAKEIARRKRVDTNTVYTWVHRARELGLLERPGGSR
jgi:hypothetical protein